MATGESGKKFGIHLSAHYKIFVQISIKTLGKQVQTKIQMGWGSAKSRQTDKKMIFYNKLDSSLCH
jgi:hypothetical protein